MASSAGGSSVEKGSLGPRSPGEQSKVVSPSWRGHRLGRPARAGVDAAWPGRSIPGCVMILISVPGKRRSKLPSAAPNCAQGQGLEKGLDSRMSGVQIFPGSVRPPPTRPASTTTHKGGMEIPMKNNTQATSRPASGTSSNLHLSEFVNWSSDRNDLIKLAKGWIRKHGNSPAARAEHNAKRRQAGLRPVFAD